MIDVRTVLLPSLLTQQDIDGRAVVVFDVLRATTSITTAVANQAKEIRVFDSIDAAQKAALSCTEPKCLAGEYRCLAPEGFDIGNSPGDFSRDRVEGKIVFFATTNGTRALLAARKAKYLLAGALVNATAVATQLHQLQLPVTLLCAGTGGHMAMEDLLGAGAVIDWLQEREFNRVTFENDESHIALSLFHQKKSDLRTTLEQTRGGKNLAAVMLYKDIHECSRLNIHMTVASCDTENMALRGPALPMIPPKDIT